MSAFSSSCKNDLLLSATGEQSWILSKLSDCVLLLNAMPPKSTWNEKLNKQNFRVMKFFGSFIPRPIKFKYPDLQKFSQLVEAKNVAFHGNFDETELEKLILLCRKPSNEAFLKSYDLGITDVELIVRRVRNYRKDYMKDSGEMY